MATQYDQGVVPFVANAALSAFRGVVISNNGGVGYSSNTASPDGFTQTDAASGDVVPVKLFYGPGTQKCALTAQPVTVADLLYAAVTGYVSPTGTLVVGKSRTTSKTNATTIEFIPRGDQVD